MHRVLLPFEFSEPTSVDEVVRLADGQGTRVLAGGVDLLLRMRLRQIVPERIVSLQKVSGLNFVEIGSLGLRFGALVSLRQIELASAVRDGWPLLAEAVASMASVQAKVMGTAVGNLCVGTPASDLAPALFALGARVKIATEDGTRETPIEEFFVDVNKTVVGPHELVTGVFVPAQATGSAGAFMKLAKTRADIAKVNTAVMVTLAMGTCADVRIALGSVAPTPVRALEAEKLLRGAEITPNVVAEAADAAAETVTPISDVRSTAIYRRRMVRVLVRDTLLQAISKARACGGKS